MTAKEYLCQLLDAQKQIMAIIAELERLYLQQSSIGSALGEDHIKSNEVHSRVESLAVNIADRQTDLIEAAEGLMQLQDEVTETIDAVEDIRYRILLRLRYLCGMTWEKIAEMMHADLRTVYRWHEHALNVVEV